MSGACRLVPHKECVAAAAYSRPTAEPEESDIIGILGALPK